MARADERPGNCPAITRHSCDGMIRRKLLDLALDPRLRRIFHEDLRAQQNILVQFRLARAIAAHRVDVNAGADHVVGQDSRILLVGGAGGDDVCTFNRLFRAAADADFEAMAGKVLCAPRAGGGINIVQRKPVNAADRLESQRLEFALRTIADHRHAAGVRPRKMLSSHRGGRSGAQAVSSVISESSTG